MGCAYTGSAGGAIVIDTPNCANEAAGMASIRSASKSKRDGTHFESPCQIILRLPGSTLLLRAAWIEGRWVRFKDSTDATAESVHYGSLS